LFELLIIILFYLSNETKLYAIKIVSQGAE